MQLECRSVVFHRFPLVVESGNTCIARDDFSDDGICLRTVTLVGLPCDALSNQLCLAVIDAE